MFYQGHPGIRVGEGIREGIKVEKINDKNHFERGSKVQNMSLKGRTPVTVVISEGSSGSWLSRQHLSTNRCQ